MEDWSLAHNEQIENFVARRRCLLAKFAERFSVTFLNYCAGRMYRLGEEIDFRMFTTREATRLR